MACIPNTPIASDWRDSGWQAFDSVFVGTPTQWWPVDADVISLANMAESTSQSGRITELLVRETASSAANIKANDLTVYIYNETAPTTPTESAVYNPSTTDLVGLVQITSADYERVSDTVWEARVQPNIHFTTGTGNTAVDFHAVALFSNATPSAFVTDAALAVRMFTEMGDVTA